MPPSRIDLGEPVHLRMLVHPITPPLTYGPAKKWLRHRLALGERDPLLVAWTQYKTIVFGRLVGPRPWRGDPEHRFPKWARHKNYLWRMKPGDQIITRFFPLYPFKEGAASRVSPPGIADRKEARCSVRGVWHEPRPDGGTLCEAERPLADVQPRERERAVCELQ